MKVREALADLVVAHGAGMAAPTGRRFAVRIGPIVLPFPNPGYLARHDLHHVALGVPPTFWGEVEVSAFEVRSGLPSALVAILCLGSLLLGALLAPRRVCRALARYAGARNVYREGCYARLLDLDLAELRARMRLPPVA
jgi:ubiquinone biosynthesis protein Coq4